MSRLSKYGVCFVRCPSTTDGITERGVRKRLAKFLPSANSITTRNTHVGSRSTNLYFAETASTTRGLERSVNMAP